jgi:hypothetical protein
LQAVVEGKSQLTPGVRQMVADVAAAARNKADRAYAAEVLGDEFTALGYKVGEDFTSAFLAGGRATISRGEQAPYQVELQFRSDQQGLDTEVVRKADNNMIATAERSRRDVGAESQWCNDLATAFARAERRNVSARVKYRSKPGANKMREVSSSSTRASRKTGSTKLRSLESDI